MKICSNIRSADAKEMRRQGELAFTMVEIAIAIGVIGFALVAIIGILPAGLGVQKDNREDTVITQDAPYFLDAIRNGAPVNNATGYYDGYLVNGNGYELGQSLDFLTNYVQQIRIDYLTNVNGITTTNATNIFTDFTSGMEIVGLLSTPQNDYFSPYFSSNYFITTATVRALSGPATSQQNGPNSGLNNLIAFTYKMEVFISPFNSIAPDTTNWAYYASLPNVDPNQVLIRSNRWMMANPFATYAANTNHTITQAAGALTYNLFEVRLRFSWPVLQNGSVGPGRQTYRTLVSSPILPVPVNGPYTNWWFFQPQAFANQPPNGL